MTKYSYARSPPMSSTLTCGPGTLWWCSGRTGSVVPCAIRPTWSPCLRGGKWGSGRCVSRSTRRPRGRLVFHIFWGA